MKSIITKEFHPGIVTSGGGLGGGPGICPYYYQVYSLKLTLIGTPDQTWYEGISTNWNGDCVLGPDSISAVFGFPGHVFRFPFSSTGQQTLYYHFYPSLNIEGTNYTGVHEFIGNNGLPSSDSNYRETIYCWVKGIGIVKRTIKTSTTIKTSLLLRYG